MKRATSITNKLSDTFNRLTSVTTQPVISNYNQDLTHLDQFQFPIQLFKKVFSFYFFNKFYFVFVKNNNLHPYLSIHSLDLLNNSHINSYIIGASNGLFRQQNGIDFILTDQEEDFLIQSSQLKNELQLTTADLRFTQLFEDQSGFIYLF